MQLAVKTMSKSDQRTMSEWAQENGKAVRQLTIRQTNPKHASGTLPLNMYENELPVGERIPTTESRVLTKCAGEVELTVSCEQQSEYDSESEQEDHQQTESPQETSEVELHELRTLPLTSCPKQTTLDQEESITLS